MARRAPHDVKGVETENREEAHVWDLWKNVLQETPLSPFQKRTPQLP